MKKIIIFFLALFTWSTTAGALTLDEAVNTAIENSNRIKQFKSLTGAQSERVKSSKSEFLPSVDLTYTFIRQEEDVFFASKNTSIFTAEGSYNLFNGFIDKSTLNKEKFRLEADTYQEKAIVADVVLDVNRTFINILKVRRNLEAAKEGVELLVRQRRDSDLRFREGLIAKNDLLKVEVELASARFTLLQVKSNLKIAKETLARTIGRKIGPDESIEDPPPPPEVTIDRDELRKEMYEKRSELKFQKSIIQSEESEVAAIKGEYLPSLDFFLTYRRLGDSLIPDGREGQFVTDTELSGTVEASWNLFDGFRTKHDVAAKKMDVIAREEELKDLEKELDLQLEEAIEKYRISSGQLDVSKNAVDQAEENYRITNNQYKEKIATVTDLLDARVFLTRARVQFNTAFYDLMLSIAEIERVVENPLFSASQK